MALIQSKNKIIFMNTYTPMSETLGILRSSDVAYAVHVQKNHLNENLEMLQKR